MTGLDTQEVAIVGAQIPRVLPTGRDATETSNFSPPTRQCIDDVFRYAVLHCEQVFGRPFVPARPEG